VNSIRHNQPSREGAPRRVMLLISPSSYRGGAFLRAAERLELETVQAIDLPEPLAREWNIELGIDFSKPHLAVDRIVDYARRNPLDAVLSLDDSATVIAALASDRLGLPHNSPGSALAARDKLRMRELLVRHGVAAPEFRRLDVSADPVRVAPEIDYPIVVKPNLLSGSRGVIRADHPEEFVAAFQRTRAILLSEGHNNRSACIVVERFIPGLEVAVEGLLTSGSLQVLALFDKPDPLDGPFFEETIYLTPSRLPEATQQSIAETTARAAASLGLREGPVHAELRVNQDGPWIIEIAGRSIGGLCSTILEFGTGQSLEELILLQAVGEQVPEAGLNGEAVGVMMIPIPGAGILRGVEGVDRARAVPGVTGVEISARLNHKLVPLPEGSSYLGFIFARGQSPEEVDDALRAAHRALDFKIARQIPLMAETARVRE
jgi:biotin carboxylase